MAKILTQQAATSAAPAAAPAGSRRRSGLPSPWITVISTVVILGTWELFGRQINPLFMSYPSAVAIEFEDSLASGELIEALLASLQPLTVGYLLCALGIPLGILIGRFRVVEAAIGPYVTAAYSMPLVALVPLFVLWFGLGFTAKVAIVFTMGIFPVIINTWAGVKAVPKTLIEVGTAFVASQPAILRSIVVPATIPYVMTGMRLAIGRCVVAVVVAEFFTAITGLGGLIINAGNQFNTAGMFVPVVVLMLIGVSLTKLVGVLEDKVAPWQRGITGNRS